MIKRAFEKNGITLAALLVSMSMVATIVIMPDPPNPTVEEQQERQDLADAIKKAREGK